MRLNEIEYRARYRASPELALCLLLARQANPARFWTLARMFGRSQAYLSSVYNDVTQHLVRRFGELVRWHPRLNSYERLVAFGAANGRRSGLGGNRIWGMIDGTFRPTCRPKDLQRFYYSGHKHLHGFKFQGIATPDGLLSSLMGPYNGPVNDWTMVIDTGLSERLRRGCTPTSRPVSPF